MQITNLPINIHIRLWGNFINRIASSAILPFIALYLANNIGSYFTGIFLSIIVLFSFLLNIIAGYICDRLPRKKILVFASYLECLCLFSLMLSVWRNQIFLFLVFYIIYIAISTIRKPSLTALIQDSVNDSNKKLVYRLDYWLINLSITLGATLGGLLYAKHRVLLFLVLSLTTLILSIVYTIFIKETREFIAIKKHRNLFKDLLFSYLEVIRNKRYFLLLIGWMFIFLAELSTSGYIAIRLSNDFKPIILSFINIDGVRMFSLINILNTIIVACFTLLLGSFTERFSSKNVLIIGFSLYIVGYTILTSTTMFWFIIFSVIIAAFGELLFSPLLNSEELELIPPQKRGVYAATSSLKLSGADLLSKLGIVLGTVLSPTSMGIIMGISLILSCGLILYSLFFIPSRQQV